MSDRINSDSRITLVNDWDFQPKLGDSKIGHHILREKEHSIILDFLRRRNEGSLLVCGFRGTGKTSSIYGAINQAKSIRENLIPVLIKATSIQFDPNNKKESLLKHLISSLHKTINDDKKISEDLRNKSKELYKNAIASEKHDIKSTDDDQTIEKSSSTKLNIILPIILVISSLSFLYSELDSHSWILSSIVVVIGVTLAYDWQKKKRERSSTKSSTYVKQEYDFAALIFEFEELLSSTKNQHKILFVLDEFDKIKDDPLDILTDLKMLINQSDALFLFITIPKILEELGDKNSPTYTLFSQTLFLKRPLFDEMKKFIANIVDKSNREITDEEEFENLQNYLCFVSKTNFFELYSVLRDNITSDPNMKQTISLKLDRHQLTKANLQRCIEWVYDRKKRENPSGWQENDTMLNKLYELVTSMEYSLKSDTFSINENKTINFSHTKFEANNTIGHSAMLDLILFLTMQGYLRKDNDESYTIIGELSKFLTDVSGIFVEEQQVFDNEYKQFIRNTVNFANLLTRWSKDLGTPFSIDSFEAKWDQLQSQTANYFDINTQTEARTMSNQLESPSPPLIPAEQLVGKVQELRAFKNKTHKNSVNLLSTIFSKQLGMIKVNNENHITQKLFKNLRTKHQNMPSSTLIFQDDRKKIESITIAISPSRSFLDHILDEDFPNKHIIFFLSSSEQYQIYKNNPKILSTPTALESSIKDLSHLEEDNKIIFYILKLLPTSENLEELFPILSKIPLFDTKD